MTAHNHREVVPGCFRCELSADELPLAPAACTERRASMDINGWGYVDCVFDQGHPGSCRFGPIVHDDGQFRKETLDA
jgi:hypothetical protein